MRLVRPELLEPRVRPVSMEQLVQLEPRVQQVLPERPVPMGQQAQQVQPVPMER